MAAEAGNLKFRFTADISELNSAVRSVKGSLGGLKTAVTGLGIAALADQLSPVVEAMSNLNTQTRNVTQAFERFNDSGRFLRSLRDATGGAVSDLALMEQSIKAVNLGVSENVLAKYFEFATIRAAETGERIDYLVTSIVNGVGRRSPLILDNLGISVARLGDNFRSAANAAEIVASIIDTELAKSNLTVEQAVKPTERLQAAWQNLFQVISTSAIGDTASSVINDIADAVDRLTLKIEFLTRSWRNSGDEFLYLQEQLTKLYNQSGGTFQGVDESDLIGFLEKLAGLAPKPEDIRSVEELRDRYRELAKVVGPEFSSNLPVPFPLRLTDETLAFFNALIKEQQELAKAAAEAAAALSMKLRAALESLRWDQYLMDAKRMVDGIGELYRFADDNFGISKNQEDYTPEAVLALTDPEFFAEADKQLKSAMLGYRESLKKEIDTTGNQIQQAIQSSVISTFISLGESIGDALSGDYTFGEGILKSFGAFLQSFGKLLVTFGLGKDVFEKLADKIGTGPLIVAAGIAAIAAGKAVQNSIKSSSGALSGGSSTAFAVAASQGDVGGYGRIAEQPDINIFLNGYELTKGLRRQNFYNDRTGG